VGDAKILDSYTIKYGFLVAEIEIVREPKDFVSEYRTNIQTISPSTKIILNKIRDEFISSIQEHKHNVFGEKQAEVAEGDIRDKFK